MSKECPKKANSPPPYSKAQMATIQPTATTSNVEVAAAKTKTDEEKVN